jgi:hypothetical protein
MAERIRAGEVQDLAVTHARRDQSEGVVTVVPRYRVHGLPTPRLRAFGSWSNPPMPRSYRAKARMVRNRVRSGLTEPLRRDPSAMIASRESAAEGHRLCTMLLASATPFPTMFDSLVPWSTEVRTKGRADRHVDRQ